MTELATVLRVDRKRVLVDTSGREVLEAQVRGRVHRRRGRAKNPVAVGDVVEIERADDGGAVILAVQPRRSVLVRPEAGGRWRDQVLVANADMALLVFAHAEPRPHAGLVDRLLVACHAGDVDPVLIFNKRDLPPEPETSDLIALYERLDYTVLLVSAESGEGIPRLTGIVSGARVVFAGPSGVGKSSLINRVLPGVELQTGEISRSSRKGKHTTTAAHLVRVPSADGAECYVVDTPGIKEFGLTRIDARELDLHFPEFDVPARCRFQDCRHVSEPGCAVTAQVASGAVARTRHGSYLAFLQEIEEDARARRGGG